MMQAAGVLTIIGAVAVGVRHLSRLDDAIAAVLTAHSDYFDP
jgi:hypothetical protein